MRTVLTILIATGIAGSLQAQSRYTDVATKLITAATLNRQEIQFPIDDPRRLEWRRTPGARNGVALYQMNLEQKKLLHELLYLTLSTSGYNKVTHLLFNEI